MKEFPFPGGRKVFVVLSCLVTALILLFVMLWTGSLTDARFGTLLDFVSTVVVAYFAAHAGQEGLAAWRRKHVKPEGGDEDLRG